MVKQQEIQSEEERKINLALEAEEKKKEKIALAVDTGMRLGIDTVLFHRSTVDQKMYKEGIFMIELMDGTSCPALEAKDIVKFAAFKKKILGLLGRVLWELNQDEWDNFLQCCLENKLVCSSYNI